MTKIFGLVGSSGSGKTTLLEKLIPAICARGFSLSTIKHTHHGFDVDKPGKDSYRHREAGAQEVMLASSERWALLHELRDEPEPEIDSLIAKMAPVDIILVEGFKTHSHPKVEVYRPAHGRNPLWRKFESVIAIATDEDVDADGRPLIDMNDVEAVADFVLSYLELEDKKA